MVVVVIAMLLCVVLGLGVVAVVTREARREGRGEFWTPEGEVLISGARERGGQIVARTAGQAGALRDRLPERVRRAGEPAREGSDGGRQPRPQAMDDGKKFPTAG